MENSSDGESDLISSSFSDSSVLSISTVKFDKEWILDSNFTFHTCPVKKWFVDLEETDLVKLLSGDNSECKVKEIGKVKLLFHNALEKTLIGIRFVPKIKKNLICFGNAR